MTPSAPFPRRIVIDCPKCHHEYEDWYRPVNLALDDEAGRAAEQTGSSVCPSCRFRMRHGLMLVREEAGVFIVEAAGEQE